MPERLSYFPLDLSKKHTLVLPSLKISTSRHAFLNASQALLSTLIYMVEGSLNDVGVTLLTLTQASWRFKDGDSTETLVTEPPSKLPFSLSGLTSLQMPPFQQG